jgi:hypothetical protein
MGAWLSARVMVTIGEEPNSRGAVDLRSGKAVESVAKSLLPPVEAEDPGPRRLQAAGGAG